MSDIQSAPIAIDTTSSNEIPIPVDAVASPTSKPEYEYVSETLYIQNLNEKIRIDGTSLGTFYMRLLTIFFSSQSIFARSFQVVW
jgi:hypothetical protein